MVTACIPIVWDVMLVSGFSGLCERSSAVLSEKDTAGPLFSPVFILEYLIYLFSIIFFLKNILNKLREPL